MPSGARRCPGSASVSLWRWSHRPLLQLLGAAARSRDWGSSGQKLRVRLAGSADQMGRARLADDAVTEARWKRLVLTSLLSRGQTQLPPARSVHFATLVWLQPKGAE